MKSILLFACLLIVTESFAQTLMTKTDVRFWEHHSTALTGRPYGAGANGERSGYDFVKNDYYSSFNYSPVGPYLGNETDNLDMVEYNGLFGNQGNFGFTSGTSNIWNGAIKGNNTTLFMAAPITFNFDTITDMSSIKNAFNAATASKNVNAAVVGKVYLVKLRNTEQYIAMKITRVKNVHPAIVQGDTSNVYFDFDYKYAGTSTSVPNLKNQNVAIGISPNPCKHSFTFSIPSVFDANMFRLQIIDMSGKSVMVLENPGKKIYHDLPAGIYIVKVSDSERLLVSKLVVE